jgi:hypothetical protein
MFIVDFEQAAYISASKIFKTTIISGCYFHFTQILLRRIQKIGCCKIYKEYNIFRTRIKMVVGLAFVPAKEVLKEYEQLLEKRLY